MEALDSPSSRLSPDGGTQCGFSAIAGLGSLDGPLRYHTHPSTQSFLALHVPKTHPNLHEGKWDARSLRLVDMQVRVGGSSRRRTHCSSAHTRGNQ